jgi:hypothetical protein
MLIALASIGLYVWLALRYPLLAELERGRANWATLGDRSLLAGLLHMVVYGLLVGLYVLALHRALRAPAAPRDVHASSFIFHTSSLVWVGWLIMSATLLFAYPGESLDVFDYLFRGRMLAEYGASPLAVSPSSFSTRPFYAFITWRGQVDTYGPLWEYGSWGVAWVVGRALPQPVGETTGALAAYITGYRLLAIGMGGLCGLLISSIVRRYAPPLAPAALLAWLWNPLLLTASAVGAHNDVIMVFWVLAALWLLQRARWLAGLSALMLAVHVKLTALLLLPVVALWLIRRIGWRAALSRAVLSLVCVLPLSWLLYAPLGGWSTLPRMLSERARFLAYAPADLLYRWLQEEARWAELDARRLATVGATLLFCLIAAGLMAVMLDVGRVFRPATAPAVPIRDADLWRCGLAVTIAYLLVGGFWFMPWYVLWALPLAALRPTSGCMRWWLPALTLGALWSGLGADILTFAPAPRLTPTQVSWISVSLLLAPLAGVALLLGSRRATRTTASIMQLPKG